jgi:hypothetical protein
MPPLTGRVLGELSGDAGRRMSGPGWGRPGDRDQPGLLFRTVRPAVGTGVR